MINFHKNKLIYLATKFYSGGSSSGSGSNFNKSDSSGGGSSVSQSTTNAQLNPTQTLGLYGTALPSMANTATGITNSNNPSFSASNAAQQGATNAINAINLNGLSPGESNAIERSTNQANFGTGNLGLNNSTNTVSNAMNFGNALQQKIALLNNTVNSASTAANAGSNTLGTVASLFNPLSSNANTSSSQSTSNSLFGNTSSSKGAGSSNSSSLNLGCFLTTACCNYKGLSDDCEELTILRKFRDTFVPVELVEEYYRIAPNIAIRLSGDKVALEYVWNRIRACVEDIKSDRKVEALNRYINMVQNLKDI